MTPTPQVGDIWADRYVSRRVRVMHLWSSGRIQLRTVCLAGRNWVSAPGKCSSSYAADRFVKRYRLLVRPHSQKESA